MKYLKKFNENVAESDIRSGNLGRTSDFTPWIVYDYDTSEEFDVTDEQSGIFDDDYSKFDDREVRFKVNGSGKAVVNLIPITKYEIELDHIDLEYLNSINEMLDPMGKWTPEEDSKFVDKTQQSEYDKMYSKFIEWIRDKDFDFYDGQEDFHQKFIEVSTKDLSVEEKASEIANYLEEKWGLYDGYQEVWDYLEKLYVDEV